MRGFFVLKLQLYWIGCNLLTKVTFCFIMTYQSGKSSTSNGFASVGLFYIFVELIKPVQ